MSFETSSTIEILTILPIYLYRYVGILLLVVGNIGNLWTVFIFLQKPWRKNVSVFYFLVGLLCNTIFLNVTLTGSIVMTGFSVNRLTSHSILCKLFFYISYTFPSYYPIILSLAAIDRLLISSENATTRLYSSKRLAYFSIGVNAALWFVFSLHILIKVRIQDIYGTYSICYYDLSKDYLTFNSYSALIIGLLILILIVILSILSFQNVRHIQPVSLRCRSRIRPITKKDFQLLRSLYIHHISYIFFSVILVVSFCFDTALIYYTPNTLEQTFQSFLSNLGILIYMIPYSTSFFIFIVLSKAFRQDVKGIVYRIVGTVRTVEANNVQMDNHITVNPNL